MSILSCIDSTICDQNISDVYRVGKYNFERQRPRPTLVKFIRSADASNVLFKRNMTPKPYVIKPDLSKLEQIRNSVLLKERWSLIQSGINCKSIKIHNHSIYVCNKIYGKVDLNNKLQQDNKKTFAIKMKEDVGMSKPKKHANKVGKLT